MLIWLFQIGETLPLDPDCRKMRTALMADVLVERGHQVVWWASAHEHQSKKWITPADGEILLNAHYRIKTLKGIGYRNNVSLRRYIDHRWVARKFTMACETEKRPDIVVASMPCYHLAFEALNYSRRNRIPIIVDVRDPWPDIFIEKLPLPLLRSMLRFVLHKDFSKLKKLIARADSVTAVSAGFLKWAQETSGRSDRTDDRVFYLGYLKNGGNGPAPHPAPVPYSETKQFIFVGTFGASYELKLLIECAREFYNGGRKDIVLYIAGAGDQFEELSQASRGLPNVILPGWIGADKICKEMAHSLAGIVPCRSAAHTFPNKIIEYLSAGLPIISSLEGEVKELIDANEFGLSYRVGDARMLCTHIRRIADNPDLRAAMSAAAVRFFEENGDARAIYSRYAEHIEHVAARFASSPRPRADLA